jgi:hypothetical protein
MVLKNGGAGKRGSRGAHGAVSGGGWTGPDRDAAAPTAGRGQDARSWTLAIARPALDRYSGMQSRRQVRRSAAVTRIKINSGKNPAGGTRRRLGEGEMHARTDGCTYPQTVPES